MKNDEKIKLLQRGKVSTVLLKMGIPTMIGMLVSALYSVVDAYFVGGLGTSQMGAVSVAYPIGQIIIGLGLIFGSGAGSYIARLLGASEYERASRTASTALVSSIVIGAAAIVLVMCLLDGILKALGATETILPYAREYGRIFITGSILNIITVTMNNIVAAEGRTKLTMISMLTGAGLNVLLDPIFIYSAGMDIQGAAIATVISQAATVMIYVWYILFKKGFLKFSIKYFTFDKEIFKQIFKIGIPIFIFQLFTSIAIGLTNTMAGYYGDSAVAAMGIVTRIMSLGTFIVFGFAKGFQPVAGYNYGAGNFERLKEATRLTLKWMTWVCAAMAAVFLIFPGPIISVFMASDLAVIEIGTSALRANAILFFFFGFQMVYSTLFLAAGKAREGGLLSISRQGIFFIPVILLLPRFFGLQGVIFSQPIADAFTIVLTLVFALRWKKDLAIHMKGNATVTEKTEALNR